MFDFHEKRKIKSVLYSKPVIGFIFGVTILLIISAYNRYVVAEEIKERLETRKTELRELETRAQLLESKVKYLEDKRGVEEELRNRFDVAKEGEHVVILIEKKDKDHATSVPEIVGPDSLRNEEDASFFSFLKFW